MKKLLVLLALAFVLCVPELCYSVEERSHPWLTAQEAQSIVEITTEWQKASVKLLQIVDDMKALPTEEWTLRAIIAIDEAGILYAFSWEVVFLYCLSSREVAKDIRPLVTGRLKWNNDKMKRCVKALQLVYGYIEKQAALHQIDKARDIIRSSLPLFDKAIQILESKNL